MTTFNFAAYIPLALRTEAPLPTARDRLEHAMLGLVTETGEYTTEIKRVAIYGKPLDDERRKHIAEEIGDTLWYLAIAADALGRPAAVFDLGLNSDVHGFGETSGARLIAVVTNVAANVGRFAGLAGLVGLTKQAEYDISDVVERLLRALNILANDIGIPLQQIADENIAKLALRYPEKFTAEAAEARADKGGADARNS